MHICIQTVCIQKNKRIKEQTHPKYTQTNWKEQNKEKMEKKIGTNER